jgi:hypothetical protein
MVSKEQAQAVCDGILPSFAGGNSIHAGFRSIYFDSGPDVAIHQERDISNDSSSPAVWGVVEAHAAARRRSDSGCRTEAAPRLLLREPIPLATREGLHLEGHCRIPPA